MDFAILAMAKMPDHILDLTGCPYKQSARIAFRMDTPTTNLEAERGMLANFFVQIGDRQE